MKLVTGKDCKTVLKVNGVEIAGFSSGDAVAREDPPPLPDVVLIWPDIAVTMVEIGGVTKPLPDPEAEKR